jgi:hypothetical protein
MNNIFPITIPPNTLEQNPHVTVVPLLGTRIAKCFITFRDDGDLFDFIRVRLKSHGSLIYPFNILCEFSILHNGWVGEGAVEENAKHVVLYPNFNLTDLTGEGHDEIEIETCNQAKEPRTVIVRLEVDDVAPQNIS